jgi:hypothetical protein
MLGVHVTETGIQLRIAILTKESYLRGVQAAESMCHVRADVEKSTEMKAEYP